MNQSLEEGAAALVPELREQINFLATDDCRHFVDPTMLHMIGGGLLTLFLKSILEEFSKEMAHDLATAAASSARDVVGSLRRMMGGHKPDPAESVKIVDAARQAVATAPAPQVVIIIASAQADLRAQLQAVMPDSSAAALATVVSQQAARIVGVPANSVTAP